MKMGLGIKPLLFAFLVSLAGLAQAHGGHDHGHWSAGLVHSLLALSIVGVAAVAAVLWSKRCKRIQQKNK